MSQRGVLLTTVILLVALLIFDIFRQKGIHS